MVFTKDNVLPLDLLTTLNERMLKRYMPNKKEGLYTSVQRVRAFSNNNDFTEAATFLGSIVPKIATLIKDVIIEECNLSNPQASDVWFQYMLHQHTLGPHVDTDIIRGLDNSKTFSTFLYCHKEWQDDWGGELVFHSTVILPKPNRLVVYSRDEEHWVDPIKHTIQNYKRMFFGVNWSTH